MLINLTAMVEKKIEEALQREILDGEDVYWSVTLLPGQGDTAAFVAVNMKGAVVGSVIQSGIFMQNPSMITDDNATDLARQALKNLRQARSEQLGTAPTVNQKDHSEAVKNHPGGVLLG